MVQEADVTCEALRNVTQEERRLREYISVTRVAIDAANEEAGRQRPQLWQPRQNSPVSWIPPSSGFT
jgi:hypothetical protein